MAKSMKDASIIVSGLLMFALTSDMSKGAQRDTDRYQATQSSSARSSAPASDCSGPPPSTPSPPVSVYSDPPATTPSPPASDHSDPPQTSPARSSASEDGYQSPSPEASTSARSVSPVLRRVNSRSSSTMSTRETRTKCDPCGRWFDNSDTYWEHCQVAGQVCDEHNMHFIDAYKHANNYKHDSCFVGGCSSQYTRGTSWTDDEIVEHCWDEHARR